MHAHNNTLCIYTHIYKHTQTHTEIIIHTYMHTHIHTCKLCVQLVRTYTKSLDGYYKQSLMNDPSVLFYDINSKM